MPHSPTEMKHRLRVGKVMTIGFVTSGDNPEAELVFFKSRDTEQDDPGRAPGTSKTKEGDMPEKFDKTKLDDAARAELERVEKEAEDATAAAATAVTKAEEAAEAQATAEAAQKAAEDALAAETDPEKDDVTKGMSPEVKAAFEKQAEENAEVRKALADEVEKRQRDAMSIRFAKGGDFEQLSGDERTDVLLKAQQALDPEDWTKLETMMKAASKQIAEGELLKEAGKEVGDSDVGEAQQAFDAEVAKAMEADPKLALPAARAHITKSRSDLYNALRKERQEANGS